MSDALSFIDAYAFTFLLHFVALVANIHFNPTVFLEGRFSSAAQSGYDVYFLIGQSNMVGRSVIRVGIDDDYSAILGRVFQYGYNSQTVTAATNPLDHVNEITGHMGLWLEFVKIKLGLLPPHRKILLVPCAQGDTSFRNGNWNPGDPLYNAALARLAAAMTQGGGVNVLKEVLWLQGEGDSLSAAQYRAAIQAMYDHMVLNASGMTAETPFIVGSITSILSGSAVINTALQDFAASNDAVHFVDLSDLSFNADNIHYSAAALHTAGQRYGAAA
ncbi:MAG TPA: sialate O-acetylesterase [Cellvibrio sp.]|nr:sialate O-acetylesterase [Cellvibrio sp.]